MITVFVNKLKEFSSQSGNYASITEELASTPEALSLQTEELSELLLFLCFQGASLFFILDSFLMT